MQSIKTDIEIKKTQKIISELQLITILIYTTQENKILKTIKHRINQMK